MLLQNLLTCGGELCLTVLLSSLHQKRWGLRLHSNPKCGFTHSFVTHGVLHRVKLTFDSSASCVLLQFLGIGDFSL